MFNSLQFLLKAFLFFSLPFCTLLCLHIAKKSKSPTVNMYLYCEKYNIKIPLYKNKENLIGRQEIQPDNRKISREQLILINERDTWYFYNIGVAPVKLFNNAIAQKDGAILVDESLSIGDIDFTLILPTI